MTRSELEGFAVNLETWWTDRPRLERVAAVLLGQVRELGYSGPIGLECVPEVSSEVALERVRALGAVLATGVE